MKKLFTTLSLVVLCGCNTVIYYPYEGHKEIIGDGGFYKYYQTSNDVGRKRTNPNASVDYYASGLPTGARCKLLGYIEDENLPNITKFILKLGGNVATQSDLSFPTSFEKNKGQMSNTSGAGTMALRSVSSFGVISTTNHSYHIFNCTDKQE